MKEDAFRRQVRDLASYNGWKLQYHTYDSRRSDPGFPDEVFAHPVKKRIIFVEFKSEKGRLSEPQKQWINMFRLAGYEAAVWRPSDMPTIERVLGREQLSLNDTPAIPVTIVDEHPGWEFPERLKKDTQEEK